MKKWFCVVLFLLFFSVKVSASSWMFLWDEATTKVDIPLGGNLQNYISKPKAYLYRDGQLVEDAVISYITTGDWLYLLTDVDTQKVGKYQVWYKAVENVYKPGQCQGYKTLVTFCVVDDEKPIFKECPTEMVYWIGAARPNYLEQITAVDNSGECTVTIDDSLVNYQVPGEYVVQVRAKDSINIAEQQILLQVKDPIGPVVTFLGENNRIRIAKGEPPSLQGYFKAVDQVDGDVTSSMTYPSFSTEAEGSFELEVTFQDKQGNQTNYTVHIEIVDEDEVVIELYQTNLILDYTKNMEEALRNNIKSAYLGKLDIKDQIVVPYEQVKNEVGSYVVTYSYVKGQKMGEMDCTVRLLSSTPPILLVENITIGLQERPAYLDHITVLDPSDPNIQAKLEYDDSTVNLTKAGTYPVRISVTNSSGLSTTEILYVTILDETDSIESAKTYLFYPFLIGIGLLGGGIGLFLYFKKKRNCNKEQNQL